MRYEPIDPELFLRNRERLVTLLKPRSIVIVHSNDILPTNADGTLRLVQNRDLFFLSGIDQEETVVVLFPDAPRPRDRAILFVRETNQHIAIWEGEKPDKVTASQASGLNRVEWTKNFDGIVNTLIPQAESIYLATNEHLRATLEFETRNDRFIKECQRRFPLHRYERLAPLMGELRMIKDPSEIPIMKQACEITEAGFRRVLQFIQPGVGEWEIEAEFLHEFVRRRSKGFAYSPIIGSGKNSCVLHYLDNDSICQDGELVLMDVAAEYANWNADMTRTVPVNGRFSERQKEVYRAVLSVMRYAASILRPDITLLDYQRRVLLSMEEQLIRLGLIDSEDAKKQDRDELPLVKKYFMHGTSHHLGLDVHDVSLPYTSVQEGMVFTVEPGIYIREEKLGIRLENNYLIGPTGNHDLMESIPIEIEEIEGLMAS